MRTFTLLVSITLFVTYVTAGSFQIKFDPPLLNGTTFDAHSTYTFNFISYDVEFKPNDRMLCSVGDRPNWMSSFPVSIYPEMPQMSFYLWITSPPTITFHCKVVNEYFEDLTYTFRKTYYIKY